MMLEDGEATVEVTVEVGSVSDLVKWTVRSVSGRATIRLLTAF
jgi:hypothetical protein